MNEKSRVFGKGFVIGSIVFVAAAVFEYVKTNGIPATKEQWITVIGIGIVAGGAYAKITLSGKPKEDEEPTEKNVRTE